MTNARLWSVDLAPVKRRMYVAARRVLRFGGVTLCAIVLLACAAPQTRPLRDQNVPIGVTTRFENVRFAGVWHVVAAYPGNPTGAAVFDPDTSMLTFLQNGAAFPVNDKSGIAVLWVDTGFRTAALGDVAGRIGVILDRSPASSPDRLRAAREVMDFNGWNVSRLENVK